MLIKECPKCKEMHQKNGTFCSRKCSNSRVWTDEDKLKKSISGKNSEKVKIANKANNENPNKKIKYYEKIKERQQQRLNTIMEEDFNLLTYKDKRIRVYHEQESKCNRCKNDTWQGVVIPLELEHRDGNHFNNSRENLELLCPNCHALTETWRGRNRFKDKEKPIIKRVTDDELLQALIDNNWNMRQALLQVGLAAKGANYPRCHKIKRDYLGE